MKAHKIVISILLVFLFCSINVFGHVSQVQNNNSDTEPIGGMGFIFCRTGEIIQPGYITNPIRIELNLRSTDGEITKTIPAIRGLLVPDYVQGKRIGMVVYKIFWFVPTDKSYKISCSWEGEEVEKSVPSFIDKIAVKVDFVFN